MKYAGVRHGQTQSEIYWFCVPETLYSMVCVGTKVLCDTRKGNSTGVVEKIIDGVEEHDAIKVIGNFFPLKNIIAASLRRNIEEIHIPWEMATSNPSSEKISKRINEFYATGGFKTAVLFSTDGELLDGYTAYLVAKMFGHDSLNGFCVNTESRKDVTI